MRRALFLLLLSASAGADLKEVFDPANPGRVSERKRQFDAAVDKQGLAAAIRALKGFEAAADETQADLNKVYATYVKASVAYWGYRRKTGAVAEAVPAKLNRPFLDWELAWKRAGNVKRRLRSIQAWAETRTIERLASLGGKKRAAAIAALTKGLKERNPHQRARCAAILATIPEGKDPLEKRAYHEKNPVLKRLMKGEKPAADTGPVTCFGIATGAQKIVYCFDRPDALKDPVLKSIDALPDAIEFNIVVSGWTPKVFRKKLVRATGTNKAAARKFLAGKFPDPRSDIHGALKAAIDQQPEAIFLLTAAGPYSGGPFTTQLMFPEPLQVAQEILHYNRVRGVRIHGVGSSGARSGNWLQTICAQFGGTCKAR